MSKKKIIIIILIALVVVISSRIKNRSKTVLVTAVEIEEVIVKQTVSASGVVTSPNEIDLAFTAIGQLQKVLVEKGDSVTKGQFLTSVYNYDTSQGAQEAKDNRDVAKHDLTIYVEDYETYPNAVGGRDEYDLNLTRLKELLSKAEANYQEALGVLSKKYLYAPFDGTIIDIFMKEGEVVGAGSAVVKLADLNVLVFEISLDQEDFGLLELGQIVEVTLDSYNDATFEGNVTALPAYADDETEEFEIEISLEQDEQNPILLNMKGDASIIISTTNDPVSALTFDRVYYNGGSEPYVWINENGKLQKMEVEIGLEGDVYTEVKTDLSNVTLVSPEDLEEAEEGLAVKTDEK